MVMNKKEILKKGIVTENPIFVLVLGMCPTLGVTTSMSNALGMGASVIFVLILSNVLVSLVRKIVPDEIRIPVYITIIATTVTILEIFLNTFVPSLYEGLGIFLPLIVVNCIILGRAEAFASKNGVIDSIFDAIGMGLGFTLGLFVLGLVRETLGTGGIELVGLQLFNVNYAASFFIQPSGGFLALGLLIGLINTNKINKEKAQKEVKA
jgi:electron transport complex protein RnfE